MPTTRHFGAHDLSPNPYTGIAAAGSETGSETVSDTVFTPALSAFEDGVRDGSN